MSEYRVYDRTTGYLGAIRETVAEAAADAARSDRDYERAGGYGSAVVVTEEDGRCYLLDGSPVWPPHGRGCGAVRWR